MEKYSRTYDLDGIKAAFREIDNLRMTRTARRCIVSLGFSLDDIVSAIQALKPQHFYKSMTTYADHRVWQDVYYAEFKSVKLYIKFMIDNEGHLLVSFKER